LRIAERFAVLLIDIPAARAGAALPEARHFIEGYANRPVRFSDFEKAAMAHNYIPSMMDYRARNRKVDAFIGCDPNYLRSLRSDAGLETLLRSELLLMSRDPSFIRGRIGKSLKNSQ